MASLQIAQNDQSTPLRRQYLEIKRRYPHAILFFRLGDFYETFDEDARTCARELEITLTTRPIGKSQRIPLAGVPHHAIDAHIARLIARGYKVAVCDQIGEASGRKMIERQVTRVLTPGTLVEDGLLNARSNNYLVALIAIEGSYGLAQLDVSTGEFAVTGLQPDEIMSALQRLRPAELLAGGDGLPDLADLCGSITRLDGSALSVRSAGEHLLSHFGAATLEPYGCSQMPAAICAAAAALHYLADTQPAAVPLVTRLFTYSQAGHMTVDPQTVRNLEIFENGRDRRCSGSLLDTIDLTRTAMGGRLLRQRLGQPLLDPAAICERLQAVQWFHERGVLRERLLAHLARVPDLERLLTRIATGRGTPRDVASLGQGLGQAAFLRSLLSAEAGTPAIPEGDPDEVAALIAAALVDDPPASLEAGGVIRSGYSAELDELRSLGSDARGYLAALEQRERERTGLRSLKVGYNRVFGYFIEVSNAHRGGLPADYERRQTLAGAERYITPELKQHEAKALSAQEQFETLEASLFRALCLEVTQRAEAVRDLASALAAIDVSAALAELAAQRGYVRPQVDGSDRIVIRQGRHAVVETALSAGAFVPNDAELSARDAQIILLTGPNMAGKSTYLRQVALIVLLAQIGSFVPAKSAAIGVVDRIFTRVGAQDDIAAGNSTFMVEMVEAAQILAHATPRSLVILDEVGRGTSTYDGLAIAQSIVEYLHNRESVAARTIFATHYHELVALARVLPRVRNYNVAVSEDEGGIVFLRTIVPGGADRSYGIHVAQLAGLPRGVVARAREILHELESTKGTDPHPRRSAAGLQLRLLAPKHPLVEEVAELDIDSLSPLEAIRTLYELRERAKARQ
ncbi:MAG TPA: DNA mismatch repair protein MutS [Dehalococcoidia bacterium]|nr:DNA mismatch repair protein MutS [Dehalococcoidia bacterium]